MNPGVSIRGWTALANPPQRCWPNWDCSVAYASRNETGQQIAAPVCGSSGLESLMMITFMHKTITAKALPAEALPAKALPAEALGTEALPTVARGLT